MHHFSSTVSPVRLRYEPFNNSTILYHQCGADVGGNDVTFSLFNMMNDDHVDITKNYLS